MHHVASNGQTGDRFGVLLVSNFLSSSYSHSYSRELSERLRLRGWPIIETSDKRKKLPRLLDMVGTTWKQRDEYLLAVVDIFSGNAFIWAEAVTLVLRYAKKPYILSLRGGNLPVFARRWPGRVSRLLHSAIFVNTPSRFLYEGMKPYRNDLILIPNSIKISEYHFRLRADPRPKLIWLRAFHKIYNPTLAPKVISLLLPDFPNVSLVMIGADKGDGSLQASIGLARELGGGDHILFPGFITKKEVPERLDHAEIFLNTTNVDNTPVSVMEAMACGLCVVSTNVGGIPYLLEDGKDALLISPDNPAEMADAIRRILTEPGLAEKLSMNARKKAEIFDWSIILPQWEKLCSRSGIQSAK